MLKNHITVALRNLKRHPGYSAINVAGLALGLACCLFIGLWVQDELSYDRVYPHAERLYRMAQASANNDGVTRLSAWVPVPLGPALEEEIPEVERAVRFWRGFQPVLGHGGTYFQEAGLYFTDPAVFDVFDLQLLAGDPQTALAHPATIVLTASAARKYFGDADPMGQVLSYDGFPADSLVLTVTGVLPDLPARTHLDFDMLVSLVGVETEQDNWGSSKPIWTYVRLAPEAALQTVEAKLPAFASAHFTSDHFRRLQLEPLLDIHLHSAVEGGFEAPGDIRYVYLFSAVGLFILLIACVNFINLTTAQAARRAREVGVRKAIGAQRGQLALQFIGEAVLMSGIAMVVAVVLVQMLLPLVNGLSGKALGFFGVGPMWLVLLPATLVVGLIAGGYPALYLSGFRPVAVLKGTPGAGPRGGWLRKGLVVFQFAIAIVLLAGTVVLYQQLGYVHDKRLGFDKEQVVVLPYSRNEEALLGALQAHPNVAAVSVSQRVPASTINSDGRVLQHEGSDELLRVESYLIDDRFLDLYQIELAAGRNLSRSLAGDSAAFLLNETAARALGYARPEEALGARLVWSHNKPGEVVGVVRDFHMNSLHEAIAPLVLHTFPESRWWRTFISVRIRPESVGETLAFIEQTWRTFEPEGAYAYFFVDESYEALHRADARFSRLFGYFAALSIFIACLGLFGLAAFIAEQRTKEVGVRKVLGAGVLHLVTLLSKEFLALVGVAFVVAVPIAYVAVSRWLDGFAYRIDPGVGVFALAGGLAVAVALVTVSYHALRAALADPVRSLRYE